MKNISKCNLHDPCICDLYVIIYQQIAYKCIKISYIHDDLLNVSANHVAILREAKHTGQIHKRLNY